MVPRFDVTRVGEEVCVVEGGSGSDLRWVMMVVVCVVRVGVVIVIIVVVDLKMRGRGVCGAAGGRTDMRRRITRGPGVFEFRAFLGSFFSFTVGVIVVGAGREVVHSRRDLTSRFDVVMNNEEVSMCQFPNNTRRGKGKVTVLEGN